MSFLKNIIGKSSSHTSTPAERRHQEDVAARLRSYRAGDDTDTISPKFSRNPPRPTRAPIDPMKMAAPDATNYANPSLGDILENWKKDALQTQHKDKAPEPEAKPKAEKPKRRQRVKTRILGFEDTTTPDAFENTKPAVKTAPTRYPTGWLVVTDGPGRGESFTLLTGMSQIGRDHEQAVQLDFGDEAISRINHAAIVYDIETHTFMIGHGGKANVVRVNGQPLITTQALDAGDTIRIGETSLQLVVFSTPDFNWTGTPDDAEAEDVATT